MPIARETFIVQVHEEEGDAVIENVRTRDQVRVRRLSEIGPQIRRWLKDPDGHDERGASPTRRSLQ